MRHVRGSLCPFLIIEARRDNLLVDALNQLWRRARSELLRPLKVKLGRDEGEEGIDHGGVQLEFFRLAIGEIMEPDYGNDSRILQHLPWLTCANARDVRC